MVVHTYGGGCHENAGEIVFFDGDTIVVRPYDRIEGGRDTFCTAELVTMVHEVSVQVDDPGFRPVRIEGMSLQDLDPEPYVIDTGVEVELVIPNPQPASRPQRDP